MSRIRFATSRALSLAGQRPPRKPHPPLCATVNFVEPASPPLPKVKSLAELTSLMECTSLDGTRRRAPCLLG
uniref:Uncharacterized protein n=1 Tax=Setaria viridis TaxID=4556 RepID=A0A4U6W9J1_SETVI|nr:hypothetical protein SEVIR_1G148600v2 [Setaria viridis]